MEFQDLLIIHIVFAKVETHLQTQRSAVKMLHERILLLVKYMTDVIAGGFPSTLTGLHVGENHVQVKP